jgi:hypothetical protein
MARNNRAARRNSRLLAFTFPSRPRRNPISRRERLTLATIRRKRFQFKPCAPGRPLEVTKIQRFGMQPSIYVLSDIEDRVAGSRNIMSQLADYGPFSFVDRSRRINADRAREIIELVARRCEPFLVMNDA